MSSLYLQRSLTICSCLSFISFDIFFILVRANRKAFFFPFIAKLLANVVYIVFNLPFSIFFLWTHSNWIFVPIIPLQLFLMSPVTSEIIFTCSVNISYYYWLFSAKNFNWLLANIFAYISFLLFWFSIFFVVSFLYIWPLNIRMSSAGWSYFITQTTPNLNLWPLPQICFFLFPVNANSILLIVYTKTFGIMVYSFFFLYFISECVCIFKICPEFCCVSLL